MKKQLSIILILVLTLCMVTGCRMRSSDETSMPTNETTTMPTTTTQMPTTTMPSTGDTGTTDVPNGTGDDILGGENGNNTIGGGDTTQNGRGRIHASRSK